MMRGFLLIGLVLLIPSIGLAQTRKGTMATCTSSCTTGGKTPALMDGFQAVVFQYTGSGTTNAKLENSIDDGSNWTDVTDGSCTTCTSPTKFSVVNPVGHYRFNITTCTSCTYTLKWYAVGFQR